MRFWFAFWALFLGTTAARADESYKTYRNARFGYSILYPSSLLVPQPEADNSDGRKFRSRDGKVTLTVYGSNNALGRTHNQEFARARNAWKTDGARITLSKLTPQYFSLSGFVDNDIFYEKTLFWNDKFCTMIWEYPREMRTRLDAPVTRSFASFSPGRFGRGITTSPNGVATSPKRKTAPSPRPTPKPTARATSKSPVRATPRPTTAAGVGVDAGFKGGY